jgi:tetratricopeptide (TPR) repeat protein
LPASLKDCYKAIELSPADPAAYLCRAEFYIASGAPQPALEDINQALLNGQNPAQAAGLLSSAKQILEARQTAAVAPPAQPSPVTHPAEEVSVAVAAPATAFSGNALPPASGMPSPAPIAVPTPAVVATSKSPVARPPAPVSRTADSTHRAVPPKGVDSNSLYREGRRYADQENFAQALPLFDQAIQLDPNFALALNARCYARVRLHRYDEAIADCSQAIRLNPSYGNAYQNRGMARKFKGDRAGASEDFHRAADFQHVAQVQK